MDEPHGTDLESCFLDALENLPALASFHGVRFDDCKRTFGHKLRIIWRIQ
jgi:hypothetical protein